MVLEVARSVFDSLPGFEAEVLRPEVHRQEAGAAAEAGEVDDHRAGDQLPVLPPLHHAFHHHFPGDTHEKRGLRPTMAIESGVR